MRITSCPVPFLKANTPFIGGHSLVELLVVFVLFAMAVALSFPSFKGAGKYAEYFGAVTILLGLRNNVMSMLLGISYERALFWHKAMGGVFIVSTIIHAFTGIKISGLIMIIAMGLMGITYLFKNNAFFKSFEVFYYSHLAGIILVSIMAILHGVSFIPIAGAIWLVDVILRSFIQSKSVKATAIELPANVIKLRFEAPVHYHAGQYAFLRIPAVDRIEFHPFSFSTSPQDAETCMHIRELGDWTRRLGDIVRAHKKANPNEDLVLDVALDGPYGSPMINLDSPEYEVFLLISGGIGITPNQSILNDLIAQQDNGRKLRKVYFLWSVKDRALVDSISPDLMESSGPLLDSVHTPLSFQPGMEGIPSKVASKDVFENRFYLTKVRSEDHYKEGNIDPASQPWLKFGRPDIPALFDEAREALLEDLKKSGESNAKPRVAVCVCGPPGLVSNVQDCCRLSTGTKVVFDCHAEVFDF